MPNKPTTFLDELFHAGQGCLALLTGNRQAAAYFDFSQRGLVGSFVAVLIAIAISAFGGMLLGTPIDPTLPTRSEIVIVNILACGLQAGIAYLVLRQMKRLDGLIPYLVATNWVALLTAVAFFVTALAGSFGLILLMAVAIGSLVILVNICRLLVTLTPLQIVLFLVVQGIGVLLGLAIFTSMFIDPATLQVAQ